MFPPLDEYEIINKRAVKTGSFDYCRYVERAMNKDKMLLSRIEEKKKNIKNLMKEIEMEKEELAIHLLAFTGQFLQDSDLEDQNIRWMAVNDNDPDYKFIPDEFGDILTCRDNIMKGRIVVQVTIIKTFNNFCVHECIQAVYIYDFTCLLINFTQDRNKYCVIMPMPVQIITLAKHFSIDVIR